MRTRTTVTGWLCAAMVLVASLLAGVPANATFPGSNGKIVVDSHGHILSVNPDGSDRVDLMAGANFCAHEPAMSPDGTRIAFGYSACRGDPRYGIGVMNIDGSNPIQVTTEDPSVAQLDSAPTWSPDGSKIAFVRSSPNDLLVMNQDGSGVTNLTENFDRIVEDPEWSPDGSKIAFDDTNDIYVVAADGSTDPAILTPQGGESQKAPTWKPDGSKIAYVGVATTIHTMDPSGGQDAVIVSGLREVWDVAWSPDGSKLAYIDDKGGSFEEELWTVDADGTDVTRLNVDTDLALDWAVGANVIEGTGGDDTIQGTEGPDLIYGFEGDDKIFGLEGDDRIFGGIGNDEIDGGVGINFIYGEGGNDTLTAGDCEDMCGGTDGTCCRGLVDGGEGNDTLTGNPGPDLINGGAGGDTIDGALGVNILTGGAGDDFLTTDWDTSSDDPNDPAIRCCQGQLLGGEGNDEILVDGPHLANGGPGNDIMREPEGEDVTFCCRGRMVGGKGSDEITGELAPTGGADTLIGGAGPDTLTAIVTDPNAEVEGSFTLKGGTGNDILTGGQGTSDILVGGGGSDVFRAKDGLRDVVNGGAGTDKAKVDRKLDKVSGIEKFV